MKICGILAAVLGVACGGDSVWTAATAAELAAVVAWQHATVCGAEAAERCGVSGQRLGRSCECECTASGHVVVGGKCVVDCHGHGTATGAGCACTAPYTEASNCGSVGCGAGTLLAEGGATCEGYEEAGAVSAPECVNHSTAAACGSRRGNWFGDTLVNGTWMCGARTYLGTATVGACVGSGCCSGSGPWVWLSSGACGAYCGGGGVLSTFRRVGDGEVHMVVLVAGPPPGVLGVWAGSGGGRVLCVGQTLGDGGFAQGVRLTGVDVGARAAAQGAVFRVWSVGEYCWLDRPLGADERTMLGTECRGVVALAVRRAGADETACGAWTVGAGTLQPYESGWGVDWATQQFVAGSGSGIGSAWVV